MERDRFQRWLLGPQRQVTNEPKKEEQIEEKQEETKEFVLVDELFNIYQILQQVKPIVAEWRPFISSFFSKGPSD